MRMCEILKAEGVEILRVYYCVHTPEENCDCRKPKAGLFEKANADFGPIDFSGTFFVGDSEIDMEAGKNAGAKTLLVLSGRTISEEKTKGWSAKARFHRKKSQGSCGYHHQKYCVDKPFLHQSCKRKNVNFYFTL